MDVCMVRYFANYHDYHCYTFNELTWKKKIKEHFWSFYEFDHEITRQPQRNKPFFTED